MKARSCVFVTLMREKGTTGVQTHIAMAANALREQGFDVTVVTPFSGRRLLRTLAFALRYLFAPLNGRLEIFWLRYGHYLYLKYALQDLIRAGKPVDVIYAHCPFAARAAIEVRDSRPIPIVMAIHFNGSQAFEWAERGKISKDDWLFRQILDLEETVLPQVDETVYVSDYMRRSLKERIPAMSSVPSEVIPNFTRGSVPTGIPAERDLIAIGTLEPRKNQQYVLRVLAELRRRGVYPTLTIVGDGEDRRMLEALASELGVASQVQFLGYRQDGSTLLGSHRLCVHAATIENCSIVLLEALAAGVPIVAGKNGGTPEILDEGSNGHFWDLTDVSNGADTLEALLHDEKHRSRLAVQARRDFELKFSFQSAGARLGNLMRDAVRSKAHNVILEAV